MSDPDDDADLMSVVVCDHCRRVFESEGHGVWIPVGELHAVWLCSDCNALQRPA